MPSNCWLVEGRVARLQLPGLSLSFDADRPAAGLSNIHALDRPWPDSCLMGVTGSIHSAASPALTDWHVRGDDLIAVYETGQPDTARVDLCWHAARPAANDPWFARIDLLVSVRTDRLDWRHDVCLESILPAATPLETHDTKDSLFNIDGWSLALLVHPADLRRRDFSANSATTSAGRLCHHLFPTESLEKGVILRARAMILFLPAAVDADAVIACQAAFIAADPFIGI